jgi:AcrR family transcriptional regulator
VNAILHAATKVLGDRPDASVDEVAVAAGVTRQTIYAHFTSRDQLLDAVIGRITDNAVAAMDAADLDTGPAATALVRVLDASWQSFGRYPLLLRAASGDVSREEAEQQHEPVLGRLLRLIRRGQDAGEFDRALPASWLVAAVIALGHAAGVEVGAGRLSADEAAAVQRESVLRLLGARGRA